MTKDLNKNEYFQFKPPDFNLISPKHPVTHLREHFRNKIAESVQYNMILKSRYATEYQIKSHQLLR